MSMHTIALTELEGEGLRAHGLDIGTPSQLSDAFRHGVKWALEQSAPAHVSVSRELLIDCVALLDAVAYYTFGEPVTPADADRRRMADKLRALLNGGEI